jgi:hypothetical protein
MVKNLDRSNQNAYNQAIQDLGEIFLKHAHELQKVKELSKKIKEEIEKISPFIQQNTRMVCPDCKEVCCISEYGYYNYEDLVYIYALGLSLPDYEFGRKDSDPCQFLSKQGCSMERSFRPSGCNWYFCDSLLEHIEKRPDYNEFDNSLSNIAELWMKLIEEFFIIVEGKETAL